LRSPPLKLDHFSFQARDNLLVAIDVAITQGQSQSPSIEDGAREDSEASAKTWDIIEQKNRPPALAVDFSDNANLDVGVCAMDVPELA
jgi:hypothetical protein